MSREAMKQSEALRLADALDELDRQFSRNGLCGDAAAELRRLHEVNQDLLKALHEALETEQEPVAWQVMVEDEAMKEFPIKDMAHDWCVKQKLSGSPYSYWIRPLYATPQPQEFVCSTGLCRFTLTQTGVGIGERGMQAYEEAKKRGWVGISDERLMGEQ